MSTVSFSRARDGAGLIEREGVVSACLICGAGGAFNLLQVWAVKQIQPLEQAKGGKGKGKQGYHWPR